MLYVPMYIHNYRLKLFESLIVVICMVISIIIFLVRGDYCIIHCVNILLLINKDVHFIYIWFVVYMHIYTTNKASIKLLEIIMVNIRLTFWAQM